MVEITVDMLSELIASFRKYPQPTPEEEMVSMLGLEFYGRSLGPAAQNIYINKTKTVLFTCKQGS